MAISDIPGLSALRTSMQWHQQRQRLLAENVSNADTPNYQARDLVRPTAAALVAGTKPGLTLARTNAGHITLAGGDNTSFALERKSSSETRPTGNAVSLDDEMLKVAAEPDGLSGGDLALHAQPRSVEDRDGQALISPEQGSPDHGLSQIDGYRRIGPAGAGRAHARDLGEHRQRGLRPRPLPAAIPTAARFRPSPPRSTARWMRVS